MEGVIEEWRDLEGFIDEKRFKIDFEWGRISRRVRDGGREGKRDV